MNEAQRLNEFSNLMNSASLTVPFVDWLVQNGFFISPASTKYHGNYEGGLYDHSAEVTKALIKLTDNLHLEWARPESPRIVGMFHDLCKIDAYRKIVDDEGVQYFGRDDVEGRKVHYEMADPILKGHGAKSVLLLAPFMTLTEEEVFCIRFHMGAYEQGEWGEYGRAVEKFPNVLYTHTADMIASKVKGV